MELNKNIKKIIDYTTVTTKKINYIITLKLSIYQ